MLTMMREMLRSKFAGLLFGLLIISMAVWGITDIFTGGLGQNVMRAGERAMTIEDFNRKVERFLRAQRAQGGEVISRAEAVETGLVDQLFALESSRLATLGFAERIGATASVETVMDEIRSSDVFQNPATGRYDAATYRQVLNLNQLTPAEYEQDVRDNRTLDHLSDAAEAAIAPPPALGHLQARFLSEERALAWTVIDQSALDTLPPPTEEDLRAFYEERAGAFQIPERRRLSYLRISPADFHHRVEIADEDLRSIYEATKEARYSEPEQRRFVEAVLANETAAREVFGRLAGGAGLETIEHQDLQAFSSRTTLQTDIANPDLAEGLFAPGIRTGAVVGPVEQNGLWVVARLEEIIQGAPFPYEDVRETIREDLVAAEAETLYLDAIAELEDQISAGFTLSQIAEALSAPLIRLAPIDANGLLDGGRPVPVLLAHADLLEQAFRLDVTELTNAEQDSSSAIVLEVNDILPARAQTFEEVRDIIAAGYAQARQTDALAALASEIAGRIEAGTSTLASEAGTLGVPVQRPDRTITRTNFEIGLPPAALNASFAADEGDVFSVPGPQAGQMTIVSVETVTAPEASETELVSATLLPVLSEQLSEDLLQALEAEIQDTMRLETNPSSLASYKRRLTDQQ